MKYPFSPEVLDALPEELAELFRALESQLLHEICSRLNVSGQLNEVTLQAIRALRSHGIELDEIKKTTGIAEKDLNKLFEDVVERNQQYYTGAIDLAGLTQPETIVEAADITAIISQCQREFGNITRSMGFLVDNGRTMLKPAKAYQWALDNAAMQIQSGAISYDQEIKSSVQQLADSGLKRVDYESGHVDSVDVAVRRAVMTGINQLNKQYAQQAMEFLETDLVQVSAHSGARDTGTGFQNHKAWQGKVYRWRGRVGNSTGQYPDFEQTCGYGDVQGILGANCRHSFSPFVEDVMERTYTDEELAHIDDGLGCEYDGKKYTAYEATQMQRRLERTIRKQKRHVNAFKDAGLEEDATAAKARLRKLNAKYREFSEAAGLPEQRERTRVTFVDDAAKAETARNAKDPTKAIAEILGVKNENIQISDLPQESQKSIQKQIEKAVKYFPQLKGHLQKIAYDDTITPIASSRSIVGEVKVGKPFEDYAGMRKAYARGEKFGIYSKGTSADSIVVHELGHQIDGLLTKKGLFGGEIGEYGVIRSSQEIEKEILSKIGLSDQRIREIREEWIERGYSGRDLADAVKWKRKEFISAHVSEYAATNEREFFAECFSELITSQHPREAALALGEILEKAKEMLK